jgi:hypothetical protein
MGGHVPIVDPVPPAGTGTTVHSGADEPAPRGLGAGLGVTVLAIGVALSFWAGRESEVETAVHAVATQGRPAQTGAPPTTASGRPLDAAFGVPFPNLTARLGWEPVGRRRDSVDGRQVRTLQYGRAGRRLAYSVVSGAPLVPPLGVVRVPSRGPDALTFETGGRSAVMSTRAGHTILVSGTGVSRVALVRAARTR